VPEFLSVKNFEKFQHYSDRTPPWIKLYNAVLDDYGFACLPDADKWHLVAIWLLASRTGNRIPNDSKWVEKRINAKSAVNLNLFISSGFLIVNTDASGALAEFSDPMLALARSREGETETEKKTPSSPSAERKGDAGKVGEVWSSYLAARSEYLQKKNGRGSGREPKLNATRRDLIRSRLSTYEADDLADACRGIFCSRWHTGGNDEGKEYLDIELALSVSRKRNNVEKFRDLYRDSQHRSQEPKREDGAFDLMGRNRWSEAQGKLVPKDEWEPVCAPS
jgi:hypothetical protein